MCLTLKDIGMVYQDSDPCLDDHIIYYGQYASEMKLPQCKINRYWTNQVTKKVPHKVLHHILIIPCFQWFFRCQRIAQFMYYHTQYISEDGFLWIPSNGYAFKKIKERWSNFKEEPCNVRLSLTDNGVNPFGELRSIYSMWPIFVINNNLPP